MHDDRASSLEDTIASTQRRAAAGHWSTRPGVLLGVALAILVIAALYRLPGVKWGFDIPRGSYTQLHPDEGVGCLYAMGSAAWFDNPNNWVERGMQVQCYLLGRVFGLPAGRAQSQDKVTIARTYSVCCGLLSIVLIALIAWRLTRDPVAALLAGFFVATSGIHLVTSFWARGQIQNTVFFFASILFALKSGRKRPSRWLFLASVMAGCGVGIRWSIALFPMLFALALARHRMLHNLLAVGAGAIIGFALITGLQWSPQQVEIYVRTQLTQMVALPSNIGAHVTAAAALMAVLTGCGLAVFVLGTWGIGSCLRRAWSTVRGWGWGTLRWTNLRAACASPWMIVLLPVTIQFLFVATIKAYDPRYTDLLAPVVAVFGAVQLARVFQQRPRARWVIALFCVVLGYQALYAAGMLRRYTDDPRYRMNDKIPALVPLDTGVYVGRYVPRTPVFHRRRLKPGQRPWDAPWAVINDLHAARYMTHSGTFLGLGKPASCNEIFHCESEQLREFYQSLYDGERYQLVHHARAAAWTPELWAFRALMSSKWLFTGDVRLLRKRTTR